MRIYYEHLFWWTSRNSLFWKCVHKTEKEKKLYIRSFNFPLKSSFSLTWVSETSENICFFYFMIGFFPMSFVFAWNISLEWWEIFLLELEALNIYCSWPKEDQKFKKGICHVDVLWILTIKKCLPEIVDQWLMTFLQIQRELLSFATFIRVLSNSEELSNLSS